MYSTETILENLHLHFLVFLGKSYLLQRESQTCQFFFLNKQRTKIPSLNFYLIFPYQVLWCDSSCDFFMFLNYFEILEQISIYLSSGYSQVYVSYNLWLLETWDTHAVPSYRRTACNLVNQEHHLFRRESRALSYELWSYRRLDWYLYLIAFQPFSSTWGYYPSNRKHVEDHVSSL